MVAVGMYLREKAPSYRHSKCIVLACFGSLIVRKLRGECMHSIVWNSIQSKLDLCISIPKKNGRAFGR